MSQVLRVFDPCANDLRESSEKVGARSRELVTADKSTVIAEPVLDAFVMEDCEGDGCFSDPPLTNESDWFKTFGEVDDLLSQLVASEAGPGRWWGELWFRNTMQM